MNGHLGVAIEDYNVLDLIGKGGFACVYRAQCKQTEQIVAIKMIDKKLMQAAGMTSRVRNEVEIHSQLKHPSVLELFNYFEDNHYVYLILEICHNGELNRYLKTKRRTLTENEARRILTQVVEGLIYLHSHNIIHRDLSLANLLLTTNMDAKIADFGLAIQLDLPDEKHYTMCGTPNYIAPEIAGRGAHGLESDVWSLGCMLYTMLVGKPPFDTDGIKKTLNKVVHGNFDMPSCLSWQSQDLITSLLKKHPSQRPTLQHILEHPFMKEKDSTPKQTTPTCNKSRLLRSISSGTLLSGTSMDSGNATMATVNSTHNYSTNQTSRHGPMRATIHPKGLEIPPQEPQYVPQRPHSVSSSSPYFLSHRQRSHSVEELQIIRNHDTIDRESVSCDEHATQNTLEYNRRFNGRSLRDLVAVPLNSTRLRPIQQQTRTACVSITHEGLVILKFARRDKQEMIKISSDGLEISVYQSSLSRSCDEFSFHGSYTYNDLPSRYWKKYQYAFQFIMLVRSKTPKVTLYTDEAKCMLMENDPNPDFEACFYNGTKFHHMKGQIKCIGQDGTTYSYQFTDEIPQEVNTYHHHAITCLQRCKDIESIINTIHTDDGPLFPVSIRRRPTIHGTSKPLDQNHTLHQKHNSLISQQCQTSPSIIPPIMDSSRSHTSLRRCKSDITDNDIHKSTLHRPQSDSGKHQCSTKNMHIKRIGWVTQTSNGELHVHYNDGQQLKLNCYGNDGVLFINEDGDTHRYYKKDVIPEPVRRKLQQVPHILDTLMCNYN